MSKVIWNPVYKKFMSKDDERFKDLLPWLFFSSFTPGEEDFCDEEESDNVNHPSHYNQGKYEVIDVIEDWKLDFSLGNAVKYIARAGHKVNTVEDLEKAIWYIQHEINRIKENEIDV